MKQSDDLFELIRSLDAGEKTYFRKHAGLHVREGGNKYMLLFDAMERQKKYDEKKLITKFRSEKFTRQFSVAKNYLYNLLLESLEAKHRSVEAELNSRIEQIDILFHKRLYLQAQKKIIAAKALAGKFEKYAHLILIAEREITLISHQRYEGKSMEDISTLFTIALDASNNKTEILLYWQSISLIFQHIKQKGGYVRTKEDRDKFEAIITGSVLKQGQHAKSFMARFFYYSCMIGYYYSIADYEKMLFFSEGQVRLLDENPHLAGEIRQSIVNSLLNLTLAQLGSGHYDKVPATIQRMREVEPSSEHVRKLIFEQTSTMEAQLYVLTKDFGKALQVYEHVESVFRESGNTLQPFQMPLFFFCKAVVMYNLGDLREAGRLLNLGLNESGLDYRSDLHCFAKIFSLVIHYELGNQDLLDSIIRSTYRYLLNRKRLYIFETLVLDFIRKRLPPAGSGERTKEAFRWLYTEFIKLNKDPFERNAFEYFDYIDWLEKKTR